MFKNAESMLNLLILLTGEEKTTGKTNDDGSIWKGQEIKGTA